MSREECGARWSVPISNSEKKLTRKERSTLAQLRSGYCILLGSYKSRIKKDANLDVCANCGTTPHDVKHLFICPAHSTTLILSDAVRELSYLEARDPYWNEHGLKGEQHTCVVCTPCVTVCLDCSNKIVFIDDFMAVHIIFFYSLYGISHGFDITIDLLLMAWNFKDILIYFFFRRV